MREYSLDELVAEIQRRLAAEPIAELRITSDSVSLYDTIHDDDRPIDEELPIIASGDDVFWWLRKCDQEALSCK